MQPIFIGDVQGCVDELDEILARADAAFGDDWCAWIAGDLVNRGPGSEAALERVRDLSDRGRAEYVLGNHEVALIEIAYGLREPGPYDTATSLLDRNDAADWVDWLRARPLAVPGELAGCPFAMVHAGVHPDWDLAELARVAARVGARLAGDADRARALLAADAAEDPDRDALGLLTRCRSVAADGRWSSRQPRGAFEAWHAVWSRRGHGYGVVYGHWALQGLHVAPGLRGLDTGCVHHGRPDDGYLTAWVPGPVREGGLAPFDVPDERLWQVRARQPYYALVLNERSG